MQFDDVSRTGALVQPIDILRGHPNLPVGSLKRRHGSVRWIWLFPPQVLFQAEEIFPGESRIGIEGRTRKRLLERDAFFRQAISKRRGGTSEGWDPDSAETPAPVMKRTRLAAFNSSAILCTSFFIRDDSRIRL
jgi:hypothetical protein